jgi:anti-sigma B factor antagonist
MDLRFTTTPIGEHIVVAFSGIADLSTAPILYDSLRRVCSEHPGETLLVDLDGLIALDDAALGLLLGAAGRARESGGDIELVCTNERLCGRLAATRLDRAITVRDSISGPDVSTS